MVPEATGTSLGGLSNYDATSRDFPVSSRAQREEALLEALGSGWIVPWIPFATTVTNACGLVISLDRIPTTRGMTGGPVDVAFRGVATALNALLSMESAEPASGTSTMHVRVVVVDARFTSLVALEALLKQRLVEQLMEQAASVILAKGGQTTLPSAAASLFSASSGVQVIVLFRRVDVLAEPLLRAAAARFLDSAAEAFGQSAIKNVAVVFYPVAEVLSLATTLASASRTSDGRGNQLIDGVSEAALEAVLRDDGSLFIEWWEVLWHNAATVPLPDSPARIRSASPRRESHDRGAFRSSVSPLRSVSRSSVSRSVSTARGGDDDVAQPPQASALLTSWQSALHRALHDYIPFRDLLVSEEARERVQLLFWHFHELQCIDTYLAPQRAVQLYQSTTHLADDEAHIRQSFVADEAQHRRVLLDDIMESEEAVEHVVGLQIKFWREESVARRALETQERRYRELATTLKDPTDGLYLARSLLDSSVPSSEPISKSTSEAISPTTCGDTNSFLSLPLPTLHNDSRHEGLLFPVSLLPNVASLLLFGREFPQAGEDAAPLTTDSANEDEREEVDHSMIDHGDAASEEDFAPLSPPSRRASYIVVDSGSQTASPLEPAPRISSIRVSLKRALSQQGSVRRDRSQSSPQVLSQMFPSANIEPSPLIDSHFGKSGTSTPAASSTTLPQLPASTSPTSPEPARGQAVVHHSDPFGSVHFSPSAYTAITRRTGRECSNGDVSVTSTAHTHRGEHHTAITAASVNSSGMTESMGRREEVSEKCGSWQRDEEDIEKSDDVFDRTAEPSNIHHHHHHHHDVTSTHPAPIETRRRIIMVTEDF
jgi:hypothetical protein